ncbi:hypothetical protein [Bradyrhizobium sp. JYMT SZCCT0428]|uniref:hypothetical protein n=1 Tax=Bradyrhizobium sp. JYMT SZCCT0428 TaxID=2807673 RepID=UPI001BA893BF|nr:hypothetical protein [Bradyrhizobium sp. JYMT SZCCT0428]MBR1154874.1 hypothetical protein [Bradyrhizobium sp. JYMT SZCCT0428]
MTIESPTFPPRREAIETFEPYATPDAFCDSLVRIERLGPCRRLVFAVTQHGHRDDGAIRAVVVKLVIPADLMAELAQAIVADDRSEFGGPVIRLSEHAVAH